MLYSGESLVRLPLLVGRVKLQGCRFLLVASTTQHPLALYPQERCSWRRKRGTAIHRWQCPFWLDGVLEGVVRGELELAR